MDSTKKYLAEALGTFTLTLFGCGGACVAGDALAAAIFKGFKSLYDTER